MMHITARVPTSASILPPIRGSGMMETMHRAPLILFLTFLLFFPAVSRADIFRQEREDGTIHFTDNPTESGFDMVMREERRKVASLQGGGKRVLPPHSLPVQGFLSSGYGPRIDPFNGRLTHHGGMDIATTYGAPIKPVEEGTVVFSGSRGGYGNMVIVAHPDGTTTLYAHTSRNLVTEGEMVGADRVIALAGSSGRSTGPHLHFEAWRSGVNITEVYIPSGRASASDTRRNRDAPIRRLLMPDGSLAFTNLP